MNKGCRIRIWHKAKPSTEILMTQLGPQAHMFYDYKSTHTRQLSSHSFCRRCSNHQCTFSYFSCNLIEGVSLQMFMIFSSCKFHCSTCTRFHFLFIFFCASQQAICFCPLIQGKLMFSAGQFKPTTSAPNHSLLQCCQCRGETKSSAM